MSYNPISFGVIRQAIRWANMPTPTLKRESTYKLPDGTITAEYSATFSKTNVDNWIALVSNGTQRGIDCFVQNLGLCFCNDIIVTSYGMSEDYRWLKVNLHIHLAKHDWVVGS